ncbi:MAG: PSD1 domain-containing protein [Verrucomicrobiales bacterium]|nr:PSD1 domain-containing protein [Verrucomicrobiales bacterium]
MNCRVIPAFTLAATSLFGAELPIPEKPEYNRDVRPILADSCFRCHGFDKNKRKADLRLDVRDAALAETDGIRPIVPGKPEESEIWKRLHLEDPEEVMPPPEEARQVSKREKEVLRRWIAQGAEYQEHWAYIPPVKTPVPPAQPGEANNPIDAFVAERLKKIGLAPEPEADRVTLARRFYFDLIGLPPTPRDIEAFVNDPAPDAASKLIDRLLTAPEFGERMAVWWLDQVRYADTIGYHSDNPMPVSPFRDYVIRSFNGNRKFDRFTIEQIAGDLLPNKSQETLVASAYNRLILSTEEGGAQPKQYEAKYLVDRVRSIGTTWLGQTFMCAECHDHKYDPVTARDFYALGAFFADVEEAAVGRRGEGMPVMTAENRAASEEAAAAISELEKKLAGPHPELAAAQAEWEKTAVASLADAGWTTLEFSKREAPAGTQLEQAATGEIFAKSEHPGEGTYVLSAMEQQGSVVAGVRIEALPHAALPAKGPGRAANGNFVITEVIAKIKRAGGAEETLKFSAAVATHEQTNPGDAPPYHGWPAAAVIDGDAKGKQWGWAILPEAGKANTLTLALDKPATLAKGDLLSLDLLQNHGSGTHGLGYFRIRTTGDPSAVRAVIAAGALPGPVVEALKVPIEKRTTSQQHQISRHFRSTAHALEPLRKDLASAKQKQQDLLAKAGRCLVTTASPNPRIVRILPRGDWQNETGEILLPATPRFLPEAVASTSQVRRNRLDLAKWLVNTRNPLTARVQVNRLWKLFYGSGIVKTLDDLGTQSEVPDHQPLLDWLACEFMESGWDLKHMVRLMVGSLTYARTSVAPHDLLARDPQNREWARGGRWRLDAEFVRDNALAISGLLVRRVGGPSVKPYQPAGYWENLNFPPREWENSRDENQWRRGLYTWWQRSYVHPSLLAFDAPTREECAADRTRSNIPQQALALLNDATYVEAARMFAVRILKEGGGDDTTKLQWAWHLATGRRADAAEVAELMQLLVRHRTQFSSNQQAVSQLVKTGLASNPDGIPAAEQASWMSVARTLLNLHETITRS